VIKLFNESNERIDWVNYTEPMVTAGKPVLFLTPRNTLTEIEPAEGAKGTQTH
jgi:hypothetical protein